MHLSPLFRTAIEAGIAADPRGKAGVQRYLKRIAKQMDDAPESEKQYQDKERLWNPYTDCRILQGTGEEEIHTLMVGIDIETPEILLAHRLRQKGKKIDAIMGHHPEGRAFGEIESVMNVQVDILKNLGVPENRAEGHLQPRREMIYRAVHARNLLRTERAAELFDIPLFCVHNSADHLAAKYMYDKVLKKEYETIGALVKALRKVPEYDHYAQRGNPPIVASGSESSRPGKVAIFGFNGGTNGPSAFLKELSEQGVGTILSMHISDEDRKVALKHHINVVQCSHMASDSLGMNLTIDAIQKKEPKIKIIEVSGFIRIKR